MRLAGDRAGAQCLLGDFAQHFADAPAASLAAAQAETESLVTRSAPAP
jgi:hypothetical protein